MAKDNRTLGKFHLTGIPPAPRGIPQVEVMFDLDANGILNVQAKDKATGKEQNITITASSGLSGGDIDRMVKEAEAHEEEDKARREAIEARNQLDSMLYNTRKLVEENSDKIPEEERLRAEEEFKSAEQVLEDNKDPTSPDDLRAALESLQSVAHKLAEAMYKNAASSDDGAGDVGEDLGDDDHGDDHDEEEGGGDDGVIDAEFEETT
jgi:molecular chaperone DnaK